MRVQPAWLQAGVARYIYAPHENIVLWPRSFLQFVTKFESVNVHVTAESDEAAAEGFTKANTPTSALVWTL